MAAAFDTPSWASGVDFLTFSPTLVTIALIPYHSVSFWNIHSQVDSRGLVDVVSVLGTSLASPAASLPCPVPKGLVSADGPFDFLASIRVLPVRPEGRREWAWGADSAPGPHPCPAAPSVKLSSPASMTAPPAAPSALAVIMVPLSPALGFCDVPVSFLSSASSVWERHVK